MFNTISRYWRLISLSILVMITVGSLTPLPHLPEFPSSDKTHHFIAYGALMFPVALRRPRRWFLIALLFVAWSGGIELVQPLINRYGEWLDLLANVSGLLIGFLLAQLFRLTGFVRVKKASD